MTEKTTAKNWSDEAVNALLAAVGNESPVSAASVEAAAAAEAQTKAVEDSIAAATKAVEDSIAAATKK